MALHRNPLGDISNKVVQLPIGKISVHKAVAKPVIGKAVLKAEIKPADVRAEVGPEMDTVDEEGLPEECMIDDGKLDTSCELDAPAEAKEVEDPQKFQDNHDVLAKQQRHRFAFDKIPSFPEAIDSKGEGEDCYVEQIMYYLKQTEVRRHPSPQYMTKQTDVTPKMREILIDWLVEVHLKFKLNPETLFLTVNFLDRFLERRAVKRTKLQLVGCTAMLVACKYEEVHPPEIRDFVYISDSAYTPDHILAMESIMLNTLKFNLTVPTPYRFTQRYLRVLNADPNLTNITLFLEELTVQEYKFLQYLPSIVAAAALYLALHCSMSGWTTQLVRATEYTETDLMSIVKELHQLASRTNGKYLAVRKKYSSVKFGEIAKKLVLLPLPW